jgi:hypothetical protein
MTAGKASGATEWRKSSYSGDSGCVEFVPHRGGVLVRDSKDPDGPVLVVPIAAWQAFLTQIA